MHDNMSAPYLRHIPRIIPTIEYWEPGMDRPEREKRQSIIDHCLEMNRSGLNQGTSGNISMRHEDGLLITPTGIGDLITYHRSVAEYADMYAAYESLDADTKKQIEGLKAIHRYLPAARVRSPCLQPCFRRPSAAALLSNWWH